MRYFKEKIGANGAEAVFYMQEPNPEIDMDKKFPVFICIPGGAYMWTSSREGEPIAAEFFAKGFSAAVVNYATEGRPFFKENTHPGQIPNFVFPNPLTELATVLGLIRSRAAEWSIDPDRIVVAGFSAGGNLAGQLSVYWHEQWLSEKTGYPCEMMKPDAVILAYPKLNCTAFSKKAEIDQWVNRAMLGNQITEEGLRAVSPVFHVTEKVPPTFLWHTAEDTFVPAENSLEYSMELQKNHVPFELHIYQKGEHGIALGDARTDSMPDHSQVNEQGATWVKLSAGWMKQIGIL